MNCDRKLEDDFTTGAFDPWLDNTVTIEGEVLSNDSTIKERLEAKYDKE